jgi:hypothetical protein
MSEPQRAPHRVVVDVGSQGDVAAHGVVEQERLLRHDRGTRRDAAGAELTQVDLVEEDSAVARVDEPDEQLRQGGLAGAGRTDERDRRARPHRELQPVEHVVVAVGEAQAADLEPQRTRPVEHAAAVRQGTAGVEHPPHPVPADDAARQLAEDPSDRPDGERQDGEQIGDLDQLAGANLPSWIRTVPTTSTASTPRFGSASSTGSKTPRIRPTAIWASRNRSDRRRTGRSRPPRGQGLDHERSVEALVGHRADLAAQLLARVATGESSRW